MSRIIIVGLGDYGMKLADRINSAVLVDADPGLVFQLKREHPDREIIGGDARDPSVLINAGIDDAGTIIIAVGKDHLSIAVAQEAKKFNVPRIVAIVRDQMNAPGFQKLGVKTISPLNQAVDSVIEHNIPFKETITEIVITQDSPALGKKLSEIALPQECVIGGVLRGQHLYAPTSDTTLMKGDALSLVSLVDIEPAVVDTITGGASGMIPFADIAALAPKGIEEGMIKEVAFLAKQMMLKCTFYSDPGAAGKVQSVCGKFGLSDEAFSIKTIASEELLHKFEELAKVQSTMPDTSKTLYALPQKKISMLRYLLPKSYVTDIVEIANSPILVAKGRGHNRIIHIIDGTQDSDITAFFALGMARVSKGSILSLTVHTPEGVESEESLLHTKRIGRVYGIDVVEDIVDGNPTLEFIHKVKSGEFGLAVHNWHSNIIGSDIIGRVIHDTSTSVLVVTPGLIQ